MEETSILRPFSFGQLYGTTLALMRRTPAALLIALVILLAFGVLQSVGTMGYLDSMVEAARGGGLQQGATPDEATESMSILFQGLAQLLLTGVVNLVAAVFVMTMLVMAGWFSINGEDLRTGELMSLTFGRPFWIALIQTIMFLVCIGLLVLVGSILLFPMNGTAAGTYLGYVGALLLLYPVLATAFRIHMIVAQDRGPWQGMIASIALANSNFVRVLGVLLLAALIYGVLAWLVALGMGGNPMGFSMMGQGEEGLSEEHAIAIRNSVTWGSSIVSSAINSIFLIFVSYLLTPLYIDLRARRGDFDPELEENV